jgi:hypothetical protein
MHKIADELRRRGWRQAADLALLFVGLPSGALVLAADIYRHVFGKTSEKPKPTRLRKLASRSNERLLELEVPCRFIGQKDGIRFEIDPA